MATRKNKERDATIGAQVRAARVLARLSATQVGYQLGISHQQMQKYETGRDSLRVSTLLDIAAIVQRPAAKLLDVDGAAWIPDELADLVATAKLARRILSIADPRLRRLLVGFVEVLASAGAAPASPTEAAPLARAAE